MKQFKTLLCICFGMFVFNSFVLGQSNQSAQDSYFYYYQGEKQHLELNTEYILVSSIDPDKLNNNNFRSQIQIEKASEISIDDFSKTLLSPNNFKRKHDTRYFQELELKQNISESKYLDYLEILRTNPKLIVSPYFEGKNGNKVCISNYFSVKLNDPSDFPLLEEQLLKHKVELVGYNKYMPLWFTLSVTPQSLDALQMANLFYETGLFAQAEPDLVGAYTINGVDSFTPNDLYYNDQWGLNNTGQNGGIAGVDLNMEAAWDITTGDNNTVIAILDQGLEADHPDLAANIVDEGYDTITDSEPAQLSGGHGVSCAGVAAAVGNNDIGISGVAPDCGLVSVSYSFHNVLSGAQKLANGINWAWQEQEVDVISNSWGGSFPSLYIWDAINKALNFGREGKGCVVVFASGNGNQGVSFPANSLDDVLAVGSISPCGERKNPMSCDSITGWGSNYGLELDIVCPGTLIPSTDMQGDVECAPEDMEGPCKCDLDDYNPHPCIDNAYDDWDYFKTFGGTSSACPAAAGVAALILSANPDLTVQQVNSIIETTATKQRTDLYDYEITDDRPNGTWNNEMGYGLVDANAALLLAQETEGDPLPCIFELTLDPVPNAGFYQAHAFIYSSSLIGADVGNVTFRAGHSIELSPGFEVDGENGTFETQTGPCLFDFNDNEIETQYRSSDIFYTYAGKTDKTEFTEISFNPLAIKNYPNPFSDKTNIEFVLPEDTEVSLFITDITGRQVAVLINNQVKSKGEHFVVFDGSTLNDGLYYYTIKAGEYAFTQKMILSR